VIDHPVPETIDFPRPRRPRGGRSFRFILLGLVLAVFFFGGTALSWYVDRLWFGSLGYGAVFWTMFKLETGLFVAGAAATFAALVGAFMALRPAGFTEFGAGGVVMVNNRPVQLPVGRALTLIALAVSAIVALISGSGLLADWPSVALWWYGSGQAPAGAAGTVDPIFGRPLAFYLFTLPVWNMAIGWLTTIAVLAFGMALFFFLTSSGAYLLQGRRPRAGADVSRGLALTWALLLATIAANVYLGRFERLFDDNAIFSGVTYTDAHVVLTGRLLVSLALAAGAVVSAVSVATGVRLRWLVLSAVPALVLYIGTGAVASYVESFVVKPNELVRQQPYIANNIAFTRQAYGLHRVAQRPFAAEGGVEAADPEANATTLQNIRLWDWRVLQDTLRQLQEIRTYYDFADIDIDRYVIDGSLRQVMLATRELQIDKLPEGSRTWINEKLIYTHGYGLTMNLVNGFTPEGLPDLLLRDMPVESRTSSLKVTRPEIYFGESTASDVYVKTRQQEFNFPQGQSNSLTSYEGTGGIVLGGFMRRLLIALERGDVSKLPFSDDITPESRLLMRRSVKDRVTALAPFLQVDPDPYAVLGSDGRLSWIMDAYTTSTHYPYSRAYELDNRLVLNYMRNSVKVVIDAYDGTTTFYVFDLEDPIIAAYRRVFPSLFRDASAMPKGLREHVRYPEMLLEVQARAYELYHMTDPAVFYNREDLWTVASDVSSAARTDRKVQPMEPNFILMKLPGEGKEEFVEMLPFTPANRNNLIGWIAGRSDGEHYGDAIVYDFPKSRLVDGPLQIEARIDQNPQLSSQLSLWNQQGSRVRRGSLLVIPIGKTLLYAEAIYLQADRSPMPELRLVVLALQEKLSYATTFEGALAGLFGPPNVAATSTTGASTTTAAAAERPAAAPPPGSPDTQALINDAARALADYQRLTAEGKLGEAGQKLEQLKRTLDELSRRK